MGKKEREREGDITHGSLVGKCCERVHHISRLCSLSTELLEETLLCIQKRGPKIGDPNCDFACIDYQQRF